MDEQKNEQGDGDEFSYNDYEVEKVDMPDNGNNGYENENNSEAETDYSSSEGRKRPSFLRLLTYGVIFFVIGFGIGWFWFGKQEGSVAEVKEAGNTVLEGTQEKSGVNLEGSPKENKAQAVSGEDSISVKSQAAGNKVSIEKVTMREDGWVAIQDNNDGELGNILGAQWWPAGEDSGEIDLLRDTESEKGYFAVIYVDNGDKLFSKAEDELVTGTDGKALRFGFSVFPASI